MICIGLNTSTRRVLLLLFTDLSSHLDLFLNFLLYKQWIQQKADQSFCYYANKTAFLCVNLALLPLFINTWSGLFPLPKKKFQTKNLSIFYSRKLISHQHFSFCVTCMSIQVFYLQNKKHSIVTKSFISVRWIISSYLTVLQKKVGIVTISHELLHMRNNMSKCRKCNIPSIGGFLHCAFRALLIQQTAA